MNKIIIQDLNAAAHGAKENELPENTAIRFEIDGFSFVVQIDTARKVLTVQKTVTAGALYVPIIIQPVNQTAISLT